MEERGSAESNESCSHETLNRPTRHHVGAAVNEGMKTQVSIDDMRLFRVRGHRQETLGGVHGRDQRKC